MSWIEWKKELDSIFFLATGTLLFAGRPNGHVRQFQISRVKKTLKPRPPGGEIFIASVIIFHRG